MARNIERARANVERARRDIACVQASLQFGEKKHQKQRIENEEDGLKKGDKPRKGNAEERRRREKCTNGHYTK